jgi:hypothetical protein
MSFSPCDALEAIQQVMSGERWTPETLEAIAEIMESAGYSLEDCGEEESEELPDETVLRGAHALEGSNGSFDAWTASVASFKGHPLHKEARRFLNLESGE